MIIANITMVEPRLMSSQDPLKPRSSNYSALALISMFSSVASISAKKDYVEMASNAVICRRTLKRPSTFVGMETSKKGSRIMICCEGTADWKYWSAAAKNTLMVNFVAGWAISIGFATLRMACDIAATDSLAYCFGTRFPTVVKP